MIIMLLAAAFAATGVEPPDVYAGNDELRGYLLEAAENNPALLAQYETWRAALERIPQVTSLDDPMLSYGQFIQSEAARARIALSQKFPWFGTLRARGDKAAAEADAALQAFFSERNRVIAEVKQAYFEYAFLADAVLVTEAQLEVLDYMEDVVKSKLALGLANQDELLRVSIEKAQVRDRHDGYLQNKPARMARLNEALGRDVLSEIPFPQATPLPPALPPAETVLARVDEANPDLKALEHVLESRERDIELARKEGYPEFTAGLEYAAISKPRQIRPDRVSADNLATGYRLLNTFTGRTPFEPVNTAIDAYGLATSREPMNYSDGGDDEIMLSLTVSVPLWRKRIKAGIEEARLLHRAAGHDKRSRELALQRSARMAIFEVEDALRRYRLYRDTLVPQAAQTYESLQSQYSTAAGGADFLDLLDSVQTLLSFELEQVRATRDVQLAAAELEFLMGGPWPRTGGTAAPAKENASDQEATYRINVQRSAHNETEG